MESSARSERTASDTKRATSTRAPGGAKRPRWRHRRGARLWRLRRLQLIADARGWTRWSPPPAPSAPPSIPSVPRAPEHQACRGVGRERLSSGRTEGVYREKEGSDVGRDDVRALGADHVAESATQGGLGGGEVPDLGAVTPLAACPINSSYALSTSKLFF